MEVALLGGRIVRKSQGVRFEGTRMKGVLEARLEYVGATGLGIRARGVSTNCERVCGVWLGVSKR